MEKGNYFYCFLSALLLMTAIIDKASAQSFNLLGKRAYYPYHWDFPEQEEIYFDSIGKLFTLTDKASQPRDPELVKYSFDNDIILDLLHGRFVVPDGQSAFDGEDVPDGSVITAMRTFGDEVNA